MNDIEVPVIDIAPFFDSPDGKRRVAAEVAAACENVGFMTVVGHGVPEALIEAASKVAEDFFALPHEMKMSVHMPGKGRGYSPMEAESLAVGTFDRPAHGDLKESFNIGAKLDQNLWPREPARMRDVWNEYFLAMMGLATRIMHVFATALGLPEDYFDDKISHPKAILRATHYPALESCPKPGQLRAGAHTDNGTLTLIRSNYGGTALQVSAGEDRWVDLAPPAGAFIVNIGDLMMRWTNDRWVSTLHRVVNPPVEHAGKSRQSLVFFHNPDPEVVIECLECCCDAENPAKYPPAVAGEFLKTKSRRSFERAASGR